MLCLAGCSSPAPTPGADAAVSDAPMTDAPMTDAPATDVPATDVPASPMAVEAIVQMCRMNNACGYQTRFFMPADQCTNAALERLAGRAEVHTFEHRLHFARMLECARTSTTCDAYVRCADFGVACTGMARATCNGTVRVACSTPGGNHEPRTYDCALRGGQCTNGECVYPATAPACTEFGSGRCEGNSRRWCRRSAAGTMVELDEPCPAGTVCVPGSAGAVSCYPLGSCSAEASRCDGDAVVNCMRMGTAFGELRQDCAAIGRRCEVGARGEATCVPRATECMGPSNRTVPTTSTCDGAQVRVCIEGRDTRIDCSALGRTGCMVLPMLAGIPARGVCI